MVYTDNMDTNLETDSPTARVLRQLAAASTRPRPDLTQIDHDHNNDNRRRQLEQRQQRRPHLASGHWRHPYTQCTSCNERIGQVATDIGSGQVGSSRHPTIVTVEGSKLRTSSLTDISGSRRDLHFQPRQIRSEKLSRWSGS